MSAVEPSVPIRLSKAVPSPWVLERDDWAVRLGREIAGIVSQDETGWWTCSVFHPRPLRPRRPLHMENLNGERYRRRGQAVDRVVARFHEMRTVGP